MPRPRVRALAWITCALLHFTLLSVTHVGAAEDASAAGAARTQIAELRREVARHDALYFRQAAPEISDVDYERLKRRLTELEQTFPDAALAVAPLAELGDDRTEGSRTFRHRERMLSLEKAYTEAELRAWHARLAQAIGREDFACVVEPKYDGFAVSITYERGRLVRALTRGNGTEGEDITANVLEIAGIPRVLAPGDADAHPVPEVVELRGEIYVTFARFARVNREREAAGEPPFANPRSLAVGMIRQHDSAEVARRGLHVVFFGLGACDPATAWPPTQRELQRRLQAWGAPAPEASWTTRSADELLRALETLRRARGGLAFPTDGAVVKLDVVQLQRQLGVSANVPRWALAAKFAPERVETRLRAITLQVGRTAVLTPVAELDPVELGGTTVARATLHNRDEIARKDIRVGDFVYVEKAGEIIPAVVGVNLARRSAHAQRYAFPPRCPACDAPVTHRPGEAAVRCGGANCPAQLRRRIEHFASKACVDITGLGPATVAALVQRGLVKDLPDLYRLRRDELRLAFGRSSGKSADQLLAAIEASKRAELWRFIHGLGIPGVGPVAARNVANDYGTLEALMAAESAGASAHQGQLKKGASRNEAAVRAVEHYFAAPRHRAIVAALIGNGVRPAAPPAPAENGSITGRTFVLTGKLPTLTRAEATMLIEEAGGKVASRVSRTTDYVIAGTDPGANLSQARARSVRVIDEPALRRMLVVQQDRAADEGGR